MPISATHPDLRSQFREHHGMIFSWCDLHAEQASPSDIKLSRDITQRHTTIPAAKLNELYGRTPTIEMLEQLQPSQWFSLSRSKAAASPFGAPQGLYARQRRPHAAGSSSQIPDTQGTFV